MKQDQKMRAFKREIGYVKENSVNRKKLEHPSFTAKADSPEQAERLTRLADEALASGGKVYVLRDKDKNCICWCTVTKIEDRREEKKVHSHFEVTALETAAGYEDELPEFEKDILMLLQCDLILNRNAETLHFKGMIYYPAYPKQWRTGLVHCLLIVVMAYGYHAIFDSLFISILTAVIIGDAFAAYKEPKMIGSVNTDAEADRKPQISAVLSKQN